jgi:C-terminal domain on Strawberry notch homologue/P-loop containing NTP hydrolase pore-1
MMTDQTERLLWPNLSAYGLQLVLAKLGNPGANGTASYREVQVLRRDPNGTPNPPLKEGENLVDRFERQARQLGFMRHQTANGPIWIRWGNVVSAPSYLREFPLGKVSEVARAEIVVDLTQGVASKKEVKLSAAEETLKKSKPVGRNRLGKMIWDGPDGRFMRDDASLRLTLESDVVPPSPGLFLRALDDATLSMCADGLIEDVVHGERIRDVDFLKKAGTYFGDAETALSRDDARLTRVRAAIEAAAARFLARRSKGSMRDVFNQSCTLHESLPFLSTFDRDGTASSDRLALPIGVVAQRVLGTEEDLLGRALTVPNGGTGQLVSHLPRGMEVRLRETDPALAAQLNVSFSSFGIKPVALGQVDDKNGLKAADYENSDLVLGRYARRLLRKPAKLSDGLQLTRADLAEVATMLSQRSDEGRAVLILDGPATPEEEIELARFQAWIGCSHAIEGTVEVAGLLHCGRVEAPPMRIMVVGRRRPEKLEEPPESAMRLKEVNNFASLWTWTAEVVANRMKLETFFTGAHDTTLSDADPELEQNAFQAPYVSASKIGTPTTMVPRPLEGACREALQRVVRLHGNIDDWVSAEFGYDAESLKASFSPEQVDALALSLHAEDRKRAFLNADQTGLGKGRFNAAHIKRAAARKRKVIFMTERPINFSDIWRDIAHIGADKAISPFILNNGVSIIDERDGSVVHRSARNADVEKCLRDLVWPAEANATLMTYSQIKHAPTDRRKGDRATWKRRQGDKAAWFLEMIDEDTVLVLDEVHNGASGDSNISKNLIKAIEKASPGNVIYSSATFAKDAKSMGFYSPLLPDLMTSDTLVSILAKGGETMQEVLSTMLVSDGVMVRREHDLSQMEFTSVSDSGRFERNRAFMDQFAPILAEMALLDLEVSRKVAQANQQTADRIQRENANEGEATRAREAMRKEALSRSGFGSPLYSLTRLFIASLKIDMATERALTALRNNEKPLILVENTIQSFLEELAEKEDDLDGASVPEFKGLVHRALTKITNATQKGVDGKVRMIDLTVAYPALREPTDHIRSMIDRLPSLPASAIDAVKERINAAGFVCDEITGRGLELRGGRVMRRPGIDKTRIKNAFNAGEIDALVINNAGCTGIDLHAGSRFADKRRRVMVELQPLSDILRQIQAYGRVNRYDQVIGPRIEGILSGLPIEVRQHAVRNAQLRRMSANVSSNRENAALIRDIPDLINSVGDRVCSRYAEARPELMRRLGFEVDRNQQVERRNVELEEAKRMSKGEEALDMPAVLDGRRSANEFLSRLIMLPVSMQEQVISELSAEYAATMEELEARGETPLKTKEVEGTVHVRSEAIFSGGDTDAPDSVFHAPLKNVEVAIVRKVDPMRKEDVIDAVQSGLSSASAAHGEALADHLRENREKLLENYLDERIPSVREGLAMNNRILVEQNSRMQALEAMLREVRPGCSISFSSPEESEKPMQGIVTSVKHARPGFEHAAAMHAVEFVCPGDVQPRMMKFKTLLEDSAFAVGSGLEGEDYETIMRDFDDKTFSKVESGRILTGNLFRGMKLAVENPGLGSLVTYETEDGTKHRGIMLTRKWRALDTLPVEIETTDLAMELLASQNAELRSSKELAKSGVSLRQSPRSIGNFQIELPSPHSRRYGSIHSDPVIAKIVRMAQAQKNGTSIKVDIDKDTAKQALSALQALGVRLFCSGRHREWIAEKTKAAAPVQEQVMAAGFAA